MIINLSSPSSTLGAGHMPCGSLHCGYGIPSMVNSSAAQLWIKPDGTQGNCAYINPDTGDYELDQFGNSVGGDSINQMVYLAFKTLLNTSAVSGFGLDLDTTNQVINDSLINRIKLSVFKAVKHMTDPKTITIVNVTARRVTPTGLEINIEWRNNITNEISVFTLA